MSESLREVLETLEAVSKEAGIHAALRFLNERTCHRFTGIYRFDRQTLRSVRLFDRQNPQMELGADAPMRETYCSIVGDTQAPFYISDASRDERLKEHPARETVVSYCGVLLRTEDGEPYGTLCHFDLHPCLIPTHEIPLLEAAVPVIMSNFPELRLSATHGSRG